ncbi:MAG TPA: aldose epimerase family protein [Bacteroidota bacterium]|nr:aldose epimerase family protein [Bacteroidota bacterium]
MIEKALFGTLKDGREVYRYSLHSSTGMEADIITFGAIVTNLYVKDRDGKLADVVLGYDSLQGYVTDRVYFGAIVGRYGNRIGKGKFSLGGKEYQLDINDGANHLHGGARGFNKMLWTAEPIEGKEGPSLRLTYVSKDGEEGYPGTLTATVTYTLTNDNALEIRYEGTTDKPTIFNPTHHSYFNLSGDMTKTILDHQLMIAADSMTPIASDLITTGAIVGVAGTPMDFRTLTAVGSRINEPFEQLKFGRGYDHNWVLRNYTGQVRKVAEVYESTTGRDLSVLTDQPGLQFYSGNFLDGSAKGKKGVAYQRRTGLCLEAQHYPDSPNKPNFPSVVLLPGAVYHQTTVYQFSTK